MKKDKMKVFDFKLATKKMIKKFKDYLKSTSVNASYHTTKDEDSGRLMKINVESHPMMKKIEQYYWDIKSQYGETLRLKY